LPRAVSSGTCSERDRKSDPPRVDSQATVRVVAAVAIATVDRRVVDGWVVDRRVMHVRTDDHRWVVSEGMVVAMAIHRRMTMAVSVRTVRRIVAPTRMAVVRCQLNTADGWSRLVMGEHLGSRYLLGGHGCTNDKRGGDNEGPHGLTPCKTTQGELGPPCRRPLTIPVDAPTVPNLANGQQIPAVLRLDASPHKVLYHIVQTRLTLCSVPS